MIVANTIAQARQQIADVRRHGKTIGLVPTMGALHEGHRALIRRCRDECDFVVVSIYVNPAQFGPKEDLAAYPRDFDADCRACREDQVDLVFAPNDEEMYGQSHLAWIDVDRLGDHLCGRSRPGFFRGVCTAVAKLFNIIAPDLAYFGEKDAQQLAIVRRMVHDLNFNLEIRPCPTVRTAEGLALSSRNDYLDDKQRPQALCLFEALRHGAAMVSRGVLDAQAIIGEMKALIDKQPAARIDYISIVDEEFLQPVTQITAPCLIALAVQIGAPRLIDNIRVAPPE